MTDNQDIFEVVKKLAQLQKERSDISLDDIPARAAWENKWKQAINTGDFVAIFAELERLKQYEVIAIECSYKNFISSVFAITSYKYK